MSPIARGRYAGTIAVLSLTVCAATASRSPGILPIPEHAPQKLRTDLKTRMNHSMMMDFVQAVVLLSVSAMVSILDSFRRVSTKTDQAHSTFAPQSAI